MMLNFMCQLQHKAVIMGLWTITPVRLSAVSNIWAWADQIWDTWGHTRRGTHVRRIQLVFSLSSVLNTQGSWQGAVGDERHQSNSSELIGASQSDPCIMGTGWLGCDSGEWWGVCGGVTCGDWMNEDRTNLLKSCCWFWGKQKPLRSTPFWLHHVHKFRTKKSKKNSDLTTWVRRNSSVQPWTATLHVSQESDCKVPQ